MKRQMRSFYKDNKPETPLNGMGKEERVEGDKDGGRDEDGEKRTSKLGVCIFSVTVEERGELLSLE